MKYLYLNIIFFSFILFNSLNAQKKQMTGEVTFTTSENIYVRFASTENINIGDTLDIAKGDKVSPCLEVIHKSSSSCVCKIINDCTPQAKDIIYHHLSPILEKSSIDNTDDALTIPDSIQINLPEKPVSNLDQLTPIKKKTHRGRISASSYSSLQENDDNNHRMMLRFSYQNQNINDSKLSFESYINYRQNIFDKPLETSYQTKFFRVYNLALMYDIDSTTQITFGRKINRKMSSIGAVDGLQIDKHIGSIYTGLIVGFRPDIVEYDFNPNLLEYGLYFGKDHISKKLRGQTTVGILEQRNAGSIDRRYAYLQHTSTLSRKTNFFVSSELDIYNNVNGVVDMKPRLTNLYLSARYRFNRKISVTLSYDARKRIIFYETLRTEVERLLADDETRQGIRARINLRPINYIFMGISYSKRFQSSNQNKSDNINGYISHSKLPGLNGRLSLNFNMNTSLFLESKIIAIRYSRSIIKKVLDGDFYFRIVNYNYLNSEINLKQNYIGGNLSFRISKKLSLNILGEHTKYRDQNKYRMNVKILKRF